MSTSDLLDGWCRETVAAAFLEAAKTGKPARVEIETLARCPDDNPLKALVSFEAAGAASSDAGA